MVAGGILAFGPERVISSTAARCIATVEPLLEKSQLELKTSAGISQDAYESKGTKPFAAVEKRVSKRQGAVLCSHGPVLPQLVSAAAEIGHGGSRKSLQKAASLNVGSFSVIHFSLETPTPQIVAVETHEPPAAP
jgi:8-oxo-dGTP diphosphatase